MKTLDCKIAFFIAVFGMVPVLSTEGTASLILLAIQLSGLLYAIYQDKVNHRTMWDGE